MILANIVDIIQKIIEMGNFGYGPSILTHPVFPPRSERLAGPLFP
jgi:hypothetical protein